MNRTLLGLFLHAGCLLTPGVAQEGRPPQPPLKLQVYQVSKADVSPPLRNIGPPVRPPVRQHRPLLRVTVGGSQTPVSDRVTQGAAPLLAQLSSGQNFEGVSVATYDPLVAPPDENLAVGPSHIVQTVNVQIGIFEKATGALLAGFPKPLNSLWTGFGGACETHNDGDPIVRYDRQAQRWIVSQLTVDSVALNFHQCLAVSQTSDPAGAYYRYDVDFGYRLQDYPKFAVWPDGWYMTANSFLLGFLLEGSNMCAWEKSKLLAGDATAKVICVVTGSSQFAGLLPSDWDGETPPPAGSPNYLVGLYTTSSLAMFKMTPNYANPGATTVTGPTYIDVAPFNLPCGADDCVPQKDSTQLLASLGDRLMYRLAYRNFGTHQSLVVNHSVSANNTVGIRWYEIRNPGGTPVIHQQGTYVPDSDSRWMGSMSTDKAGNIAVGYSKSGPAMYPGIFITGRESTDSLGALRAEQTIWSGSGSQLPTLNRWGDYSSIETDPADDCTFWYTSQYLPANGTFNWRTRIASFRFDACGAKTNTTTAITNDSPDPSVVGQPYPVSFTVTPASGSGSPTGTVTVTDGTASCSATVAAGNCTLVSTTAGAKTLTASYSGDNNFSPSSATASHQVNKAATTTTINSDSPDPSTVGQSYTVTFSVTANSPGSGTPTGTVAVSDGTGGSCSGSVTAGNCSLTSNTAGTLSLTAAYGGDGNFNGSTSASASHTVTAPLTAPAAPTGLTAKVVKNKRALVRIDLAWTDNSNNEDSFVIERWKLTGKSAQTCVLEREFTVGPNVVTYSDTSASTATCKYRVAAENTAGRSNSAETNVNP